MAAFTLPSVDRLNMSYCTSLCEILQELRLVDYSTNLIAATLSPSSLCCCFRMTPQVIRKICKELKLYTTPELNDILYLHFKGGIQARVYNMCTRTHT